MNSILTTNSEVSRAKQQTGTSPDVETTGSLAMNNTNTPIFDMPIANYDMFIPTNPFSLNIDFGSYAEQRESSLANNSTFMQGFATAMTLLNQGAGSFSSFGGAGGVSIASSGCAGGSCSAGGGFTSVG